MNDLEKLDRHIEEKLAAHEESCRLKHNHHAERMHEFEERHQRYTAMADRLVRDVIRPRMERLAGRFENAELLGADQAGRHQCVCSFRHTSRFPATARLVVGLSHDGDWQNAWLLYNLSILPVFFQFNGQDQKSVPLDRVDEKQVAAWVEEKLFAFLDTYLRLQTEDQYQNANLVTDPVCNMRINRLYAAAQMEYQSQTYYFCIPECREKFAANPEKYLGVAKAV